jgi:UDP-sugar transporter A1/2/3
VTCLQILTIAGLGCSTSLLTTLSKRRSVDHGYAYWPPVVIITAEFWKATISMGLLVWWGGGHPGRARVLVDDANLEEARSAPPQPFPLWPSPASTLRLAGLAALYALQNNLLFAAMRQVNLATYQVLITLRIPATAGLMWAMLGRAFSRRQQGAIACLVAGVVLSQVDVGALLFAAAPGAGGDPSRAFSLTPRGLAYMAATVACASLASVTNETMLKNEAVGFMHAQNCVLYAIGCVVNAVVMGWQGGWAEGGAILAPATLFHGFDACTWALVASLTLLGLATAAVLKHADNMIRSLGYVGSIVLAALLSAAWLGTPLTPHFAAGAGVACVGIVAYMAGGGGDGGGGAVGGGGKGMRTKLPLTAAGERRK